MQVLSNAVRTGAIGDGKIFATEVGEAIRIRDEARGEGGCSARLGLSV